MGRSRERYLPLVFAIIVLAGAAVASESPNPGLKVGERAPSFEVKSMTGESLSSERILRERKALVLTFWGLRCGSCIEEMPFVNDLVGKYGTDISVLGINVDGIDGTILEQQIKKSGLAMNYTVVPDPDMKLIDLYKMNAAPLTVVVDNKGDICYYHEGFIPGDEKTLDENIRKLIR